MSRDPNMIRITTGIIEQLLSRSETEDILSDGLELLGSALKSEAGAILIPEGQWLHTACSYGPADLTGMTVERAGLLEDLVIREGKTRFVSGEENRKQTFFDRTGYPVSDLICVPLRTTAEAAGCLTIVNSRGDEAFSPSEQQLCERVAALIAMVMEENGFTVPAARERGEILVRARDIVKDYPSGSETLRVLKGINLDIFRGEFIVLLGESGCGKSTLVNIIAGMDDMTDGSLTIEGKDFSHPDDRELTAFRRNDVGFVFQDYNLMPNLTALENVRFLAELVPDPMDPEEALEKVGLRDRADHYPSMLSGGQQQRVSIARALVKKPKFIFADEPTAALDYRTSIEVLEVFEEIVRSRNTTVIMITHNPEIGRMAHRVIRIRDGRIANIKTNRQPARARELSW